MSVVGASRSNNVKREGRRRVIGIEFGLTTTALGELFAQIKKTLCHALTTAV